MISQLRCAIMAMVDDVASESEGTSPSVLPSKRLLGVSSFAHTPCYCEENVYLLCEKLCKVGVADPVGADLFVVFISNEKKMVPLWHQKASKRSDGLVLWDYHVICIQKRRGEAFDLVWDLDSDLPFPSPLTVYLPEAIKPVKSLYCRLFRVVHAPRFLRCFASDRSHMRDGLGNWLALPPTYEPITSEDGTTNNLDKYIEMRAADALTNAQDSLHNALSNEYGVVVSETMLDWFFAQMHQ